MHEMERGRARKRNGSVVAFLDGPAPDYDEKPKRCAWRRGPCSPFKRGFWIALASLATIGLSLVALWLFVRLHKSNMYPIYDRLNYTLNDTYMGATFFDGFRYFYAYDPSNGFVDYVDADSAKQQNLTFASKESAILRVLVNDHGAAANGSLGRNSVRIQSRSTYDKGLFIFDILHTPYGCGTWPALWTTDPDSVTWPKNGEIDVIEAVNNGNMGNQMALHTTDKCLMDVKRKQTGKILSKNCLNSTNSNQGCAVQGPTDTYGKALNDNGGGIYAMELRNAGIRIWFFPRHSTEPEDIRNGSTSPDPSSWGEPLADFPSTNCNITEHFRQQRIIANIDLCGGWVTSDLETTYNTSLCPNDCKHIVRTMPSAFREAYWEFKSFKVYRAQNDTAVVLN